mgnify:CR=1 FL=1
MGAFDQSKSKSESKRVYELDEIIIFFFLCFCSCTFMDPDCRGVISLCSGVAVLILLFIAIIEISNARKDQWIIGSSALSCNN